MAKVLGEWNSVIDGAEGAGALVFIIGSSLPSPSLFFLVLCLYCAMCIKEFYKAKRDAILAPCPNQCNL